MESEPVLMEIHLSEARLTNGITNDGDIICLPWRVVLGSATTGALPKKFEAVFNSEGLRQSV